MDSHQSKMEGIFSNCLPVSRMAPKFVCGTQYSSVLFCSLGSLRGSERLYIILTELIKHAHVPITDYNYKICYLTVGKCGPS